MSIKINEEECVGCGACVEVCPAECILINKVAEVDEEGCLECGACVEECPNCVITF